MIDIPPFVNHSAYMKFKDATDALFNRIDHANLAKALGVSVASIRQARLGPAAKAHRAPPDGWREAAIRLAESRVLHYRRLIERLEENRTKIIT
jgi:hypothetical protein